MSLYSFYIINLFFHLCTFKVINRRINGISANEWFAHGTAHLLMFSFVAGYVRLFISFCRL